MSTSLDALIAQERLPVAFKHLVDTHYRPLAAYIAESRQQRTGPFFVGINGAQGSGKSTLARVLALLLREGWLLNCAELSLDDLYLTRAQRQQLARQVHPLLETRGVPGTHDLDLGCSVFAGLRDGADVLLPRFDKARDDRSPEKDWAMVSGPVDVVLFEGWCVGAVAQPDAALHSSVNSLEQQEDSDGRWRHYVNQCLAQDYPALFTQLDLLVMLKIPDWSCVTQWRGEQERKLADTHGTQAPGVMDNAALQRFIMHYERLTRWMLAEMPARADWLLELDAQHQLTRSAIRKAGK